MAAMALTGAPDRAVKCGEGRPLCPAGLGFFGQKENLRKERLDGAIWMRERLRACHWLKVATYFPIFAQSSSTVQTFVRPWLHTFAIKSLDEQMLQLVVVAGELIVKCAISRKPSMEDIASGYWMCCMECHSTSILCQSATSFLEVRSNERDSSSNHNSNPEPITKSMLPCLHRQIDTNFCTIDSTGTVTPWLATSELPCSEHVPWLWTARAYISSSDVVQRNPQPSNKTFVGFYYDDHELTPCNCPTW
ncbi:hypothetical protein BT63DRAFT_474790 [Microthyrium microscopicum]|uniref:Uncharacterized protein n=1 Tax=Microthyrium microscopicum TaxID=703497 RepID=A0A6A6USA8_9PEZI|nr:hypothetical protein BT63DRAFT_474790 [Microthyrium microscopicum]